MGFGNDLFVAVGDGGTIRTSADGVTWNPQTSGIFTSLFGVAHGNNTFVAVGAGGFVRTSSDGVNWGPGDSGTGLDLNGVAFGKGIFVAVGNNGTVLISATGATWASGLSGTTNDLQDIAVGNGPFVAVGIAGTIRTSPEGVIWGLRTSGTSLNLNAVGYGKGTYVATGATGTILQSNPVIAFNDVPLPHFAFTQVDAITVAGITTGCQADNPATLQNEALYCPDNSITRAEMAVFIETSLGNPPNICIGRFTDVPVSNPYCGFIERLAADGITGGCTPTQFCPDAPVTRAQMAVFIETALGNPPNACLGRRFIDVTAASVGEIFCGFIERLTADGITGGCTANQFCPNNPVTRAQMAVFLVAAPPPLNP